MLLIGEARDRLTDILRGRMPRRRALAGLHNHSRSPKASSFSFLSIFHFFSFLCVSSAPQRLPGRQWLMNFVGNVFSECGGKELCSGGKAGGCARDEVCSRTGSYSCLKFYGHLEFDTSCLILTSYIYTVPCDPAATRTQNISLIVSACFVNFDYFTQHVC